MTSPYDMETSVEKAMHLCPHLLDYQFFSWRLALSVYLYSIQLRGHLHAPSTTVTIISTPCPALRDGSDTGSWKGVWNRLLNRLQL